uniref:Ig-like domain-containing protein n=1 Tax=Dicentrarchus labrax TaxID=13489 RepID=A0A8P4KMX6_DICLA
MLISHILQVYKMSGFSHFLLCFWILGYMFCCSRAWHVKMPSNIKGLVDSCLVIPCSFDYYQYPPYRPDRVVWYQYVSRGYPLVYDRWYPEDVINIFRGRTRLFSPAYKTCSLEISRVKWSDHRQKIYPWVDPENVGKSTYRFFDTTVTIEVVDRAEKPHIMISGERKVGQPVTVQCTVYHTCPTYPPTLSLNVRTQHSGITHSSMSDGTSRTTLTTTLNIERDLQTVECMVRHISGHSETASVTLISECSFLPLTITPTTDEFLEGQPSKVTCTAVYTCPKHIPTFKWNYGSMPTSTDTRKSQSAQWKTVSTLTFTASASDHGRSLTCSAQFTGGQRQEESITLRVKKKTQ